MRLKKWLSLVCITAVITAGIPVTGNSTADAAKTKTTKDGMVLVKGGTF